MFSIIFSSIIQFLDSTGLDSDSNIKDSDLSPTRHLLDSNSDSDSIGYGLGLDSDSTKVDSNPTLAASINIIVAKRRWIGG